MPSHNPPSRSKTATHSDTRKVPRRAALGSIGTVGLASLAGCLSFFGVNHLYVRGSTATIPLGYSHDPSCSASKIPDGAGFWYGPLLMTGTLDGDFDTLRIALLNGNTNFDGSTSDHTLEFEV